MILLDPRAIDEGARLAVCDVVGSTNAEALALALQGKRGPLWIVAERQTAGRGRRGRTWVSQRGNLFATLLLTTPAPAECRPQLSLVAALAVHDAVAAIAPGLEPRMTIKWPNDLLLDGAKFAGILVEAADEHAVAIGIGINCVSHPARTDYPATDLAAAGVLASPIMLVPPLSLKMMLRLAQWNGGEGFSIIRADWLARAAAIGKEIRLRMEDRELCGRLETLDGSGGLVLRLPDGHAETITAADVLIAG
jgi:BirA family transcriptional regulator, biotin operon repressor / biotin---[acetyl-CoA-carboxylase] ligase